MNPLVDEIRTLMRRASLLDAVVGPLVFTVFNFLYGPTVAVMAGLGSAAIVVAWRTFRRGALTLALSGVGGTVLASLLVAVTGQANDYFLPGIVSGVFTTVALLVSLLVGYPLVAVISSAMRRWPLQWFRHPRVKSACTLTTWIWLVFFAARTGYQLVLYRSESIELLAAVRILTGWPALVVLLATTYVVGRRKLVALGGPSVDEWSAGAQPPWQGQTHGF